MNKHNAIWIGKGSSDNFTVYRLSNYDGAAIAEIILNAQANGFQVIPITID